MKAVIWTDVLQAVVILVGLLATIIQGLIMIEEMYSLLLCMNI
jgi:Na+/proline symporter